MIVILENHFTLTKYTIFFPLNFPRNFFKIILIYNKKKFKINTEIKFNNIYILIFNKNCFSKI